MVQVREELKPKVEAESVGKCCFFVCFAYHVCLAFSHNPEPQTQGMWLSTMGCTFPYQSINNTISHRRACQSNPGNPSSEIPFSVDSRLYQVDSLKLTGTTLKVNLFSDNNREKNNRFHPGSIGFSVWYWSTWHSQEVRFLFVHWANHNWMNKWI